MSNLSIFERVGRSIWRAWHRVGFFNDGDFTTTTNLTDGGEQVTLSGLPANMFPGDTGMPKKVPVGKGQRLVIDPGGENLIVQVKDFVNDQNTIIFDPVTLVDSNGDPITISSGADVGFPPPLSLFVGDVETVEVRGTIPFEDDRGNSVNDSPPNLDIVLEMAHQPSGPWYVPDGLSVPAEVNLSDANTGSSDRITSARLVLPPLPYLRARVNGGVAGSVFSFDIHRTRQ